MKTLVLHHSKDLDGYLSGVIANYYLEHRKSDGDIIVIAGADYGDKLDALYFDKEGLSYELHDFDKIYVIDFSDDWLFNSEYRNKIMWIDHHIHAINKEYQVNKFVIDGVAACRLTQQFFSNINYSFLDLFDFQNRKVTEPLVVALAGEYDIWDETSLMARPFNFGLAHNLSFGVIDLMYRNHKHIIAGSKESDKAVIDRVERLKYTVDIGKAVIDSIQSTSSTLGGGVPIEINGVKGRAFNTHIRSSIIHHLQEPDKFIMVWNYTGKSKIKLSFYSEEDTDISVVACHFGGGGHKRACGCQIDLHTLTHILTKPYNF